MKTIIIFLLCAELVSAADMRTLMVKPGTCVYVKGTKVCAINPVYQVITTEGISIPISGENQRQIVIPNEGSKELVIINEPKSGPTQICHCEIKERAESSGFTIEKETTDYEGKKVKTFVKVVPNSEGCYCK